MRRNRSGIDIAIASKMKALAKLEARLALQAEIGPRRAMVGCG